MSLFRTVILYGSNSTSSERQRWNIKNRSRGRVRGGWREGATERETQRTQYKDGWMQHDRLISP